MGIQISRFRMLGLWGFSNPYSKDSSILVSIVGSPYLKKQPFAGIGV